MVAFLPQTDTDTKTDYQHEGTAERPTHIHHNDQTRDWEDAAYVSTNSGCEGYERRWDPSLLNNSSIYSLSDTQADRDDYTPSYTQT